ncbi:MAG: pyridoxamine 5'-phosphate oxidase family protein [Chloroflexi bacterium]|nr:pyridoxamine 5'-phosphate oxidase family protein [Chloroflexota bacterium]
MTNDILFASDAEMRRKDRAVTDEKWIVDLLNRAPFGVMATVWEGRPFTVARNFAYDPEKHAVYMHGAQKGRTYDNVQTNDRVCLNVSEMGRLLPAPRAMNFSVEFSGVVIFGRVSLVTDADEAKHGLQLLSDKHFPHLKPGQDYEPTTDTDLKITAVYRIDIESWSGKQKKVADDFPGAFYMSEKLDNKEA